MRPMNLFSQIKTAITAQQAAKCYRLRATRNGMNCCQTGNVIHFTAGLFHTSLLGNPLECVYSHDNDQGEVKPIHDKTTEYQSSSRNAVCS